MPRQTILQNTLLNNSTATGASTYFNGGKAIFYVIAGTGGATIRLETLGPDGVTWIPVNGTSTTTSTAIFLELAEGAYRSAVVGGTSPAGIYAQLKGFV